MRTVLVALALSLVAGSTYWALEDVRRRASTLAAQEYQSQQALLARLAAERLGDALRQVELELDALVPPADPAVAEAAWLTLPPVAGAPPIVFLHDATGRLLRGEAPAHDHRPNTGHWVAGSRAPVVALCDACLRAGFLTVTRPLRGHPGLFVTAAIPQERLHRALFASLSGAHAAYVWVMRRDGTIVSSPDPRFNGTRPFADLDGPPADDLAPILAAMKAGRTGTGTYRWPEGDRGLTERLVAYTPVDGRSELSAAYSADRSSVVARVNEVNQAAEHLLMSLIAAFAIGAALLVASALRRARVERRARLRVAAAEARYRATFNQSADALFEVEPAAGVIRAQNRAALDAVGDVCGQPLTTLHPPTETASVAALLDAARAGSPDASARLTLRGHTGDTAVSARAVCVQPDAGGAFISWALHDVSALDAAHDQVMRMERLSTVGLLTASIGHELKNPLAYVRANVEMAGDLLAAEDLVELADVLADTRVGVERITEIVAALGQMTPTRRPVSVVDVRGAIETALLLARPHVRRTGVRVETELDGSLPVQANAGEMAQVILNLVVNAAQACGGDAGQRHRIAVRGHRSDDEVRIEVEDDGPGIPGALRPRIFEAMFTTKAEGDGSGLGLSIARRIVERFGGSLSLADHATPTTFVLSLPAATAAGDAHQGASVRRIDPATSKVA